MIEAQRAAARRVEAVLTGHSLARLQDDPPVPVAARAAAMDLTQGTLRHLGQLRAVVAQLATRGVPEAPIEALLVVALYQLLHTRAAPYAIVDHAVTATREHSPNRAAAGFVNALLRRFLRERDPLLQRAAREPEGRWSHPAWWVRQLEAQYGAAAAPILEAGLDHPPMALRANLRRIDPIVCAERLAAAGFAHRVLDNGALLLDQPVAAAKLPGYAEGELSIQDAGAQWAAILLDAVDGDHVLDACAAPGGKAAHIAERANVDLLALDREPARLDTARALFDRLGLQARFAAADALAIDSWWDGRLFDRILLDAPCTASGIVRRHPDAKWLRRPADVALAAADQARLLDALWRVLRPGGTLLYATCSVFREENRDAVAAFLSRHDDAHAVELPVLPGQDGQLLPNREHDGFFYARLVRSSG